MCTPSIPKPPPIPEPEAAKSPVSLDVISEEQGRRAKLRAKSGYAGTVLTNALGESEPKMRKTLLGA